MFQTADESHARVWYVMQCGLFSWVVISGLLEILHAWSCVVTISSISGIDIMEASINLASSSHAGLKNSSYLASLNSRLFDLQKIVTVTEKLQQSLVSTARE